MISKNTYTIRRTGQTRSFDAAKKRISKLAVGNRIDHILSASTIDRTTKINKHDVRTFHLFLNVLPKKVINIK